MKSRIITLTTAAVFLFGMFASNLQAQKLAAEKTHEMIKTTKKRGKLSNVVVDDTKQQIDLIFTTKAKRKLIKFDVYQFDYDLNLINSSSEEQEIDKARSKYKWFMPSFKTERYTVQGLTAEGTMGLGNMVVKKKETTFLYNFWTFGYQKRTKVLDKVKFEDPRGRKMIYSGHYENDQTGELIALGGIKGKKGGPNMEPYLHTHKFQLMRISTDLQIVNETTIDLKYIQVKLFDGVAKQGDMDASDESFQGDWILVYAPMGGQGTKKWKGPVPINYTYMRISPQGEVKETINFTSKVTDWMVMDVYAKGDDIYIYGPGVAKNVDKKWQTAKGPTISHPGRGAGAVATDKKYENFQLVRIRGGKADFVSAPNLDDFEAKTQKPPAQKKPTIYRGKRFEVRGLDIGSNGDIFINGQNFVYGGLYKDMLMFHFTKDGELKACYGLESTQKSGTLGKIADAAGKASAALDDESYKIITYGQPDARRHPTDGNIFESKDGKSLYWMLFPVHHVDRAIHKESGILYENVTTIIYTPRKQIKMGKIDIASGKVDDFVTFGNNEQFLIADNEYVEINGGKQLIFLGAGKGMLWLGKFDPAKL